MGKPYLPEFRRKALDLVAGGRSVVEAELLGVTQSCLYRWKGRDLVDRGQRPGTTTAETAELAEAQARIRDLEEEGQDPSEAGRCR